MYYITKNQEKHPFTIMMRAKRSGNDSKNPLGYHSFVERLNLCNK